MDRKTTKRIYAYAAAYLILALAIQVCNCYYFNLRWVVQLAFFVPFLMPLHLMMLRKRGKFTFTDTDYLWIYVSMFFISVLLYTLFYFL